MWGGGEGGGGGAEADLVEKKGVIPERMKAGSTLFLHTLG